METPRFFKDGVPTSEEVGGILGLHMQGIAECVFAGYDVLLDWRDKYLEHYLQFSPTTCAGIVHDAMVARAAEVFRGMRPDVAVIDALGSKVITFYDRVVLRFKKLSANLEPRNARTKQQEEFSQHTLWPDLTNLTAGYRLDATGQEIRDVQIVCWYCGELLWNIELPYTSEDVLGARPVPIVGGSGTEIIAKLPLLDKTGTEEE